MSVHASFRSRLLVALLVVAVVTQTAPTRQAVSETYGDVDAFFGDAREDECIPFWGPYVSSEFRGTNHRALSNTAGFVPLVQDGQRLLFADLRGQFDDAGNREGNWGLGLRSILTDDLIVGGYGFYDRLRSSTGNSFEQFTFGLEAKTYIWDVRANGYLADESTQLVGPDLGSDSLDPRAFFDGNTILLTTGGPGSQLFESSYSGVDFEIGTLLLAWGENNAVELRSYIGGYYFGTSAEDFPSMAGPRGRLELTGFDLPWLGQGSRLTIGGEYAWDDVRDSEFSGVVRVQVPLNFFRQHRLCPFHRRMLDRVQRDVDVVTRSHHLRERIEETVYADNGHRVGPLSLASKESLAKHGQSLREFVDQAGSNSTVIVDGSKGAIQTDSSTIMHPGQTLRGGGFQVRGVHSGAIATFGSRPQIVNSNQQVDTIVVAPATHVQGLDIVGGLAGISSDLNNSHIIGNRVSGADSGFHFGEVNENSSVRNNEATGNHGDGFLIDHVRGGHIVGNTASENGNDGFHFQDIHQASLIESNLARANAGDGMDFDSISGGMIANNQTIGNQAEGIRARFVTDGSAMVGNTAEGNQRGIFLLNVDQSDVSGNTARGNSELGFLVAQFQGTFSDNLAENNGTDGFILSTVNANSSVRNNEAIGNHRDGFSTFQVRGGHFIDNTAAENGRDGFVITRVEESSRIEGNLARANTEHGMSFDQIDTSEVANNQADGNGMNGFRFVTLTRASVLNNIAEGNVLAGFDADIIPAESNFSGNVARGNSDVGFRFTTVRGEFTDNRSENNVGHGFSFVTVDSGLFSANRAEGNGFDAEGNLLNADANGVYFAIIGDNGVVTNNSAIGNANNGFAGTDSGGMPDDLFLNFSGDFTDNTAENNGDQGYRGFTLANGTSSNNTGSGNAGGGHTFP